MNRLWIGFVPFAVVSIIHIVALAVGADAVAGPTKLLLMPLLAVAVFWGGRGSRWGTTYTLLFTAIALSWLGDGAGTFFPLLPTVPMMLLFFGLAHLCYIWLFWRVIPVRRVPRWALVYGLWWVGLLLAILWPHLGGLLIAGRDLRARARRHGGRGIPLPPARRGRRRVLPRVRHDPRVPPLHARRDARLDEPARHAHVLPRSGADRRRCHRRRPPAGGARDREPVGDAA